MINRLHKLFRSLTVIGLITLSLAGMADDTIEVIPLKHRLAEELVPSLQPFMDKQGVITAQGNQLIIRTSPQNLAQIKQLVNQLDMPPRRLLIEVRQPLSESRDAGQTGISGQISLPDKNGEVILESHRTASRDSAVTDQQVQVLEGHAALIKTGQLVPMAKQQLRDGRHVETVIEQQDVSSGFQVIPRLTGDTVMLEIMPFSASLASGGGGVINQQQAFTTLSGKLGEWIEISGVVRQHQKEATTYSTHDRREQQRQILIKVTELK